ncbi:hypothetical protein IQ255_03210 [Pleurocapsales cyanobacterium LEGE 10410]|nr:hypothetical protein [Pleurocapsales cyanobacterium LEGE 10410]
MSSYYSNYTTCIRNDNLDAVRQAIINLLEREGGSLIHKLPSSISSSQSQIEDALKESNKFWIVELFKGINGWTVIKTYPYDLLCFPIQTKDDCIPFLSALAIELGFDAFYIGVYDSIFGILLEANSAGKFYVSGVFNAEIPNDSFYKQPINSPNLIERFFLLNVSLSLQLATQANNDLKIAQKENEVFQGHTERIDRALAKELINSNSWYIRNLFDRVKSLNREPVEKKPYLIYFQSPPNYKLPQPYTLTRNQWLEIYGIEPPLDT